MTSPQTYHETSGDSLPDQIARYHELSERDLMAGSIAMLKARGTYQPNEHVTNAILYSASSLPGGQVTVSVRAGDGLVRVVVTDQGTMPPDLTAPRGLGQGLAIVTALADVFGADGRDRWFALRTGGAQ